MRDLTSEISKTDEEFNKLKTSLFYRIVHRMHIICTDCVTSEKMIDPDFWKLSSDVKNIKECSSEIEGLKVIVDEAA